MWISFTQIKRLYIKPININNSLSWVYIVYIHSVVGWDQYWFIYTFDLWTFHIHIIFLLLHVTKKGKWNYFIILCRYPLLQSTLLIWRSASLWYISSGSTAVTACQHALCQPTGQTVTSQITTQNIRTLLVHLLN